MTEADARIQSLAHGGAGVGSITASLDNFIIGKTVFVRETIPEELVSISLTEDKKRFAHAELLQVIEKSPYRRAAPCPLFGRCGGCDLQHIADAQQRQFKLQMVESTLRQQAGLIPQQGVNLLAPDLPYFGYRRRVIFHLSKHGEVCYYEKASRKMLPVEQCPIARPEVNSMLSRLRDCCKNLGPFIEDLVAEVCDGQEILEVRMWRKIRKLEPHMVQAIDEGLRGQFSDFMITYHGAVQLVRIKGELATKEQLTFPVGHFAQVNEAGNRVLQQIVVEYCKGSDEITELYAGAGNFTFPLAGHAKKVVAVEADRALVAFGQELAKQQGLGERVEFVRKSCEKYVRKNAFLPTLLLDPPRSGAKEAVEACNATVTNHIVYVSCGLPTLARDLKILLAKGYQLERVDVLDMFPQTHHVETVSVLSA